MIKQQYPDVKIIGIDVDDKILSIAKKKIEKAGVTVQVIKYDGESLSFMGYQVFDRIVSALVFHYIPTKIKRRVFTEIYKVVKPGCELHIADFGKATNFYTKIAFELFRRFDGKETTEVNAKGLLPQYIKGGGFNSVDTLKSYNTAFGTINLLKANSENNRIIINC